MIAAGLKIFWVWNKKIILAFLLMVLLFSSPVFSNEIYPFHSAQKRRQFMHLSQELRCLVCQNESLAASQAALAMQLRQQVYQMVKVGDSNQQIKAYMVARYGDFILFKPPILLSTYVLWFGPFMFLLIGGWILFRVIKKQNSEKMQ